MFEVCAFFLTSDISRNILHKFAMLSMEQPYWCTFVVHQHGGHRISLIYFGPLSD